MSTALFLFVYRFIIFGVCGTRILHVRVLAIISLLSIFIRLFFLSFLFFVVFFYSFLSLFSHWMPDITSDVLAMIGLLGSEWTLIGLISSDVLHIVWLCLGFVLDQARPDQVRPVLGVFDYIGRQGIVCRFSWNKYHFFALHGSRYLNEKR